MPSEANGKRLLLDTNAIVALLRGDETMLGYMNNASWVGISIISQIEFMAFPGLSKSDKKIFESFLKRVDVIGINKDDADLIELVIQNRKKYRLKLPDSIIISTAMMYKASLVTADKALQRVTRVSIAGF